MRFAPVLSGLCVVLFGGPLWADVDSGPPANEKTPSLTVFAVTGDPQNKELDYVAERKGKPTVYVFVQADKFDRPIARFLKTLDGVVKKEHDDAQVVAVWLTDDKEKTRDYLPRAQQSIRLGNTALTYFPGETSGPKNWNINLDAHVTIVVANKGKVAESKGHRSINEEEVDKVRAALKKAVAGK